MKKTDKNKIEEFIRVDHAGERGAIKIYEGQLLALNTLVKDDKLKKKIEEMKNNEKKHLEECLSQYFSQHPEIDTREVSNFILDKREIKVNDIHII